MKIRVGTPAIIETSKMESIGADEFIFSTATRTGLYHGTDGAYLMIRDEDTNTITSFDIDSVASIKFGPVKMPPRGTFVHGETHSGEKFVGVVDENTRVTGATSDGWFCEYGPSEIATLARLSV